MGLTVLELIHKLSDLPPDTEVTLIVPWGYPTILEQVDAGPDGVILSGRTEFDATVPS